MCTFAYLRNVAVTLVNQLASVFTAVTAGGTGDNTAVTGATIDRQDANTGALAGSALLSILWSAALGASATLTLKTVKLEQSSDSTTWDSTAFTTFTDPGVVATGTGTKTGTTSFAVDLAGAKRYVRLDYTPDLSAANTDTATLAIVATLGGYDRQPT